MKAQTAVAAVEDERKKMKFEPITRESKKAKVRKAIVKAALELFERQGFERTTVDEIAAAAEISTRTFFRYFQVKDHVMFPYHSEYVATFRNLLAENRNAGPPIEIVRGALKTMAELYMADRQEHRRYQRIISSSPALVASSVVFDADWEAAIADVWLNKLRATRNGRAEAGIIAGAIMGAINAVMSQWHDGGCRGNLAAIGESALNLIERGIGNRAGHAVADSTDWKQRTKGGEGD